MKANRFICDFSVPGMLHAVLLRSPAPRGKILGIEVPELQKNYKLIKAEDIPGANMLSVKNAKVPVLAELTVNYVGEPIAILVGPDRRKLYELRDACLVAIEPSSSYLNYEKFSSDQIFAKKVFSVGNPVDAFREAAQVFEKSFQTGAREHWYSEPHGALAYIERESMIIRTSTQWPFHVRETVSTVLDIQASDIVVKASEIGKAFDGKLWYPSQIAAQAALASFLTKKPVKIQLDREEDFLYSSKRTECTMRYKTAIDSSGDIIAIDAQFYANVGAYGPFAEEYLESLCASASGVFRCKNLRVEAWGVITNTPPFDAFVGFGYAQGFLATGTQAASISGLSADGMLEWLERNSLSREDSSQDNATPIPEILSTLSRQSDFSRKQASYELLQKQRSGRIDGSQRGIGIALCYQNQALGATSAIDENFAIELTLSKELKLEIRSSAVPSGENSLRFWAGIASRTLGIPEENVLFSENSTDSVPDSGPSGLSRNASVIGKLVEKACMTIQAQRLKNPLPIKVKKSFKALQRGATESRRSKTGQRSWGGAVVEVEIDSLSLEVDIKGVWLCVDAGNLISAARARRNLEAAVFDALGIVTRERLSFPACRVPSSMFYEYGLACVGNMPQVHIEFIRSEKDASIKGIGELPSGCVPAALINAISQAAGKTLGDIPVDGEQYLELADEA